MEEPLAKVLPRANEQLRTLGPVWVHLKEYRITFGYLHLLLVDRGFRRLGDVYLVDCESISGPTSGGPWAIRVAERPGGEGVILTAGDGELTVEAGRVRVEV